MSILPNFSSLGSSSFKFALTDQNRRGTRQYVYRRVSRQLTTIRRFRQNLRRARTYGEWKAAAADLDQHLSNDIWCEDDEFAYYDYQLIRRVMNNLRTCRESGNIEDLKGALEACIKANFGNSCALKR
jgi:hypothetical protein